MLKVDLSEFQKTREEALENWAFNVIQRWTKEIRVQDVSNPDKLISSLRKKVYNASGGDKTKIVFTFLNYGRFADLGVGRGEKYNKIKHERSFRSGKRYPETPGYSWQVKPWLRPLFKQRIYSLARLLEHEYNEYTQVMFFQNINPDKFINP